jgi:hypothetical protein
VVDGWGPYADQIESAMAAIAMIIMVIFMQNPSPWLVEDGWG